ncbi:IucA/IucC family protein [Aquimarina hainanensis]|uniref:IucA/IucC family protein n=1 Tax=Aquimarina hainanensis TaxID=1578017 RepID=A0ABW5N9L3_9FLAO|nr:IucA/IucC family protein [Aquimarina sp. TRL1]QKX03679.1 hypothetical protein HN014_01690 [Aquimarina sp. TRL1]
MKSTAYRNEAEKISFTALLNCYIVDIHKGGTVLNSLSKESSSLQNHFKDTSYTNWIHLPLNFVNKDIYCPVTFKSLNKWRYSLQLPVIVVDRVSDTINFPNLSDFSEIVLEDLTKGQSTTNETMKDFKNSILNSCDNTEMFLKYRDLNFNDIESIHAIKTNFIDADQAIIPGPPAHPVPKSRSAISDDDLIKYSPETKAKFKVHYFLAHPEYILENNAEASPVSTILMKALKDKHHLTPLAKQKITENPTWKLLPLHPWEATYLQENDDVFKELLEKEVLFSLGEMGPDFTATSSFRTVYAEDSDFMLKFSLHIKITNSVRCNLYQEMVTGYEISKLMNSEFGRKFKEAHPNFVVIKDPGYITLKSGDHIIKGCNTCLRENPFTKLDQNIFMLGQLCQQGVLGYSDRLHNIISHISKQEQRSLSEVSLIWFKKYIHIFLDTIISVYNEFGLIFEAHHQNTMLEIDEAGYPYKIYFRDSQGFYFRESKSEEVAAYVPDIELPTKASGADDEVGAWYAYYFFARNVMEIVTSFAIQDLIEEKVLLEHLRERLAYWKTKDETQLASYLLDSDTWQLKSNLLTRLSGKDEALNPVGAVTHIHFPNPLAI